MVLDDAELSSCCCNELKLGMEWMYFAREDMNFGNQEQNTMFWILCLSKIHVKI